MRHCADDCPEIIALHLVRDDHAMSLVLLGVIGDTFDGHQPYLVHHCPDNGGHGHHVPQVGGLVVERRGDDEDGEEGDGPHGDEYAPQDSSGQQEEEQRKQCSDEDDDEVGLGRVEGDADGQCCRQ